MNEKGNLLTLTRFLHVPLFKITVFVLALPEPRDSPVEARRVNRRKKTVPPKPVNVPTPDQLVKLEEHRLSISTLSPSPPPTPSPTPTPRAPSLFWGERYSEMLPRGSETRRTKRKRLDNRRRLERHALLSRRRPAVQYSETAETRPRLQSTTVVSRY